jgi:hypothetical protein
MRTYSLVEGGERKLRTKKYKGLQIAMKYMEKY